MNPRPHYFCHISLMLLSTAALAAQAMPAAPTTTQANVAATVTPRLPAA